MTGMAYIYSKEYGEDITYYTDDLNYSDSVMGCGMETGKPYMITFDQNGKAEDIEEMEV